MDKDRQVISDSIFGDDIHRKNCQEKGKIYMWLKCEFHYVTLYQYSCMGSLGDWKNLKTRWLGWRRAYSALVSEAREWILSPTSDDFKGWGWGCCARCDPSESPLVFPHIDLTQIVEILPHVRHGRSISTDSIPWVLMFWRRKEPGHQQQWSWLCWTVIIRYLRV